ARGRAVAAQPRLPREGPRRRARRGRHQDRRDQPPSAPPRMSYDLLDGVRVVELSMYAFAPSAAAVLSDWGAEVIKVVPPNVADPMMGTPIAGLPDKDVGVAFMWELMNRGKRCI